MKTISIIIPCYNEEQAIRIFYEEFIVTSREMGLPVEYELIFVDDGSTDNTIEEMRKISNESSEVGYISFSRNFGKEAAMLAGLEESNGDFVTVMDVDLQDPPMLLKNMYEILKTGEYDCVAARRSDRNGERRIRSWCSDKFYSLINAISDTEFVSGARDFRLMSRQMVDSILELEEYNRFSKGIFSWVGYKTTWISYDNVERSAGETKWSFYKLLKYSIEGIVAFSTKPLALSAFMGILCIVPAVVLIVWIIIKTLIWGDPVPGYPSLMCVMLFVAGIQLFSVGIIGQYISKIYLEVKNRPKYIVRESNTKKYKGKGVTDEKNI